MRRSWQIIGVSLFALAMAAMISYSVISNPQTGQSMFAALAFITLALLGSAVARTIAVQAQRIDELERRLRERDGQWTPDGTHGGSLSAGHPPRSPQ